jgi:hypothetical protein
MAEPIKTKIEWTNKEKVLSLFVLMRKNFLKVARKKVLAVVEKEIVGDAQVNATKKFKTSNFKKFIIGFATIVKGEDKILAGLRVDLLRVPYARIHEFSGTIKPKTSKFLTIPFPGVKGFAREFKNTFFQKSKKGNLILFQNLGKTATGRQRRTRNVRDIETRKGFTIKPLFVLKKKVEMPKREYLSPAIISNIPKLTLAFKSITSKDFE